MSTPRAVIHFIHWQRLRAAFMVRRYRVERRQPCRWDGNEVPSHRDCWPEYCELMKAGVPERPERPEDSAWRFGDPAPEVSS